MSCEHTSVAIMHGSRQCVDCGELIGRRGVEPLTDEEMCSVRESVDEYPIETWPASVVGRLLATVDRERKRADENFTSYERVKGKLDGAIADCREAARVLGASDIETVVTAADRVAKECDGLRWRVKKLEQRLASEVKFQDDQGSWIELQLARAVIEAVRGRCFDVEVQNALHEYDSLKNR